MTTFAELKTAVASQLRDPDGKTFDDADLADMINMALAEIGSLAPARFQEDVDLVQNQFEYTLRQDVFTEAIPELEVNRVELWDTTVTPNRPVALVQPASGEYINFSNTGWSLRDGVLELPYSIVYQLGSSYANYLLRVWGYSPYPALVNDTDVLATSNERENALKEYCWVLSLKRLNAERDLYTQWQTRSGNTDVSPASLMSLLNTALSEWRRISRKITVLREVAG